MSRTYEWTCYLLFLIFYQIIRARLSANQQKISEATPSFILRCRSIRVGTYKYLPTEAQCCVRISKEGFLITVPQPNNPTRLKAIALLTRNLLRVEAYFSPNLNVISLLVVPLVSRREGSRLGLHRNQGNWNSHSVIECEKYLTIVPTDLNTDSKAFIQSAFRAHGVFREISRSEASRRLISSVQPEAPRMRMSLV